MNKAELIEALSKRLGDRKTASTALDSVLEEIQRAVAKGERVAITGFGVFEKRVRGARTARNPRTGESVKVKKTSVPAFRAGQGFKDVVTGSKKLAKAPVAATASTGRATKTAAKATTAKATAAKTTRAKAAPARTAAAKTTTTRKSAAAKKTATKAPARKTSTRRTAAK